MPNEHDRRYKRLFKNPEYLKQLLETFVDEDFVKDLDFKNAITIDKSFISGKYKERESDIIYILKYKDREIYIYILLEFQSTVDRFMAQRMLRYILELYETITSVSSPDILPAVFPLLLYNGDAKWTAPENIDQLIESAIPPEFIPHFRYFKISENEFSKEDLLKIKNAVGALFLVENLDKNEIEPYLNEIFEIMKNQQKEVVTEFVRFVKNYFLSEPEINEEINKYDNEMRGNANMLAKTVELWKEELLLTGEQKGFQKGSLEGARNTRIETANKMLLEGFDFQTVNKITGLSIQEIEELKK